MFGFLFFVTKRKFSCVMFSILEKKAFSSCFKEDDDLSLSQELVDVDKACFGFPFLVHF